MRRDFVKAQEWRRRSVARYARRRRNSRNDAVWRAEVLAARGAYCRACGDTRNPQTDHLIPRAQGGPSVVPNGIVLGGPFGCGHHVAKTEGRLRIRREWLDPEQLEWLAAEGHVLWLENGETVGRHRKLFAEEVE